MIFAFSTDDRGLHVFSSQQEATSYCESIDVEDGLWLFWNDRGEPLQAQLQKHRKWLINVKYHLVPSQAEQSASLADVLDGGFDLEDNPFFTSATEVIAFITHKKA